MKIKIQTRLPDGKNMRVIFPLTHSFPLYRRVDQQRIKIGITHIHTHIHSQTDRSALKQRHVVPRPVVQQAGALRLAICEYQDLI